MLRQPTQMKNSNIWQQAGKAKKKDKAISSHQKTLIIVGEPSAGKSTFIKVIRADLDMQTKPTCLLQYTYIKKMTAKKQLLSCYQIASKSLSQVISSLITKQNYFDVYLIVCVDLGKPQNMIDELVEWLKVLRKEVDLFVQDKVLTRDTKYLQFKNSISEKAKQSQDKDHIVPMPLKTIIIGCKYDRFQRFDTQDRKWVSRCLRFVAHTNNCSLFYTSSKNMQAAAQFRSILHDFLFQENKKNSFPVQKDHTKPIFIQSGVDSIQSMSLPSSSGSFGAIQILKKQITSLFPLEQQKKKEPIETSKYIQTKIDALIEQKRRQLNKLAKNTKF